MNRPSLTGTLGLVLILLVCALPQNAGAQTRILVGTAAPEDSIWHQILLQMKQDWERIAGDQLEIRIYPGGTQGDESAMLDKVRNRAPLHAVGLSGAGLAQADTGVSALQVPMMFSSYDELDYVFERLRPTLERRLEAAGFVVLNWSDVGWVRFFTKTIARRPEDVRRMRLFTSAGDPETERLWRSAGFSPVPMAVTDIVPNLSSNLIDAFDVPPLFALADQSFGLVEYMLNFKWAPLIGATLINRATWETIPADLRPRLLTSAREAAAYRQEEIRALDAASIAAMQDYGLEVIELTPEDEAAWYRETEAVWDTMREEMVPADLFDQTLRLIEEFRRSQP